jgi:hypothetical protein
MNNRENNHRKSKEELKWEKQLNRSLRYLSKATLQSMGVTAVQEEESVFCLSDGSFVKIYSIKNNSSLEMNKEFVSRLCRTTNRVRLSSFYKCINQKYVSYLFLSVYFEAESYADVVGLIQKFDEKLYAEICRPLNLNITTCTVENVLSIMHMNCTGKMKQFDHNTVFSRKGNWEKLLFPEITETNCGEFKYMDKIGLCFLGKIFPDGPVDIKKELLSLGCNIQIAVDMQSLTEAEKDMFNHELENKYQCRLSPETESIINVTYLLALIPEQNLNQKQLKKAVMNLFDRHGMLLVPCADREKKVFQSICSMGIINFHSMKNASVELVSSLYL